jgi:hypothetical protein
MGYVYHGVGAFESDVREEHHETSKRRKPEGGRNISSIPLNAKRVVV